MEKKNKKVIIKDLVLINYVESDPNLVPKRQRIKFNDIAKTTIP